MGFWKNIAESIVRSAGYQVPVDLKTMKSPSRNGSGFNTVLGALQQNGLAMPKPPAPPADPNDLEAQQEYNQALRLYNQKFQGYHTQVMTMFMQRFNLMQQAIWMAQRNQAANSTSQGVSSPLSNPGVGGILGSSSDV